MGTGDRDTIAATNLRKFSRAVKPIKKDLSNKDISFDCDGAFNKTIKLEEINQAQEIYRIHLNLFTNSLISSDYDE